MDTELATLAIYTQCTIYGTRSSSWGLGPSPMKPCFSQWPIYISGKGKEV